MILKLLGIIVRAIPVAALVALVYFLLRRKQMFHWREALKSWVKMLPVVWAITLVGGIAFAAYTKAGEGTAGGFKMGYNYAKASEGLTPSGTFLDVSEILSDDVLERTIAAASLDVEKEALRSALEVSNVQQSAAINAEDNYVSTEYRVTYRETEATRNVDCSALLPALAETYEQFFSEKYGRKTNALEFNFSEIESLDYLDVTTYLNSAISNVIDYMDMCEDENSTFVSERTGESFGSIEEKARTFRDVSLERYNSFVLDCGLSKDKQQYISKLNYENRMTHVSYMKNLSAYNVRMEAINRYDGDITRAVLVPSRDDDGEFYQSRTKLGTDYFAEEANDYLENATDRQLEIETNNYYIQSLTNGTGQEAEYAKADEMIQQITGEVNRLTQLAIDTVEDFDTRNSESYIAFSFDEVPNTIVYVAGSVVKYMIVVFALWSVAALMRDRSKQHSDKVVYRIDGRNRGRE